jgi:hypothetical protein
MLTVAARAVPASGVDDWVPAIEIENIVWRAWDGPNETYWEFYFWTNNTERGDELGLVELGSRGSDGRS